MKRLLLYLILQTAALSMTAQSITVDTKRGHVSKDELTMSTYPLDTAATALVLCENTEVSIDIDGRGSIVQNYTHYIRYKILKEAGKDEVDYRITYYRNENIGAINVVTYNLEDDKIKKSKLESKYVFRENVHDNVFTCSFSARDVRVGSVVEISYLITSPYFYDIPKLHLQQDIPVNQIHASFTHPDFIYVRKLYQGYLTPEFKQSDYPLRAELGVPGSMVTDDYRMADVPALRKEPNSLCPSQYNCHVSYTISQIIIPGHVYETVTKKWTDVDKAVKESDICTQCKVTGHILDPFKSTNPDEKEAILEVRDNVLKTVKYNGNRAMTPKTVKSVVKEGTGNSADINAIVASTLNSMGYHVSPVLLRKRTSGVLGNYYVRPDAFTNMILQVSTPSGEIHYLDAGDEHGYLDIVDPLFLVDEARVIPCESDLGGSWVNLTNLAKGRTSTMVQAKLEEDGVIRGEIALSAHAESAYMVKQSVKNLGTDEKYIEFVNKGEDFESTSYEVQCSDYSPEAKVNISFEQEVSTGGEFIYINPFLIRNHHESEFPDQERHMPIDFLIQENENYRYEFTIPDGYEVAELPSAVAFRSDPIKAQAMCQTKLIGNNILVQFTYKNKALMANATQYEDIRAFWECLCNIYKGRIVLKKRDQ